MLPISSESKTVPSTRDPHDDIGNSVMQKVKFILSAAKELSNEAFINLVQNLDKIPASKVSTVNDELTKISKAMQLALNFVEAGHEPVLHDAIRKRKPIEHIEALLSSGANPQLVNSEGQRPLDLAIANDSVETAQLLMRNKATTLNKEALEKWIAYKSSDEIASFLHAGFHPTLPPPDNRSFSTRVLWIHSSEDGKGAIRAELQRLSDNKDLLVQFVGELARQKSDILQHHNPDVILFGWGLSKDCPNLTQDSWDFLTHCLQSGFVTSENLTDSLSEPKNSTFCLKALAFLPNIKPEGEIRPFYERYLRRIKLGLFGTLRNPPESIIKEMADRIEWDPKEWNLLMRFHKMPLTPQRSALRIDPAIDCYLQALECLPYDKKKALHLFRQAGKLGLQRGNFEAGRILLLKHGPSRGFHLIKKAAQQGVFRALQFLALSPDIPFATLKKHFDVEGLIRALQGAEDPAAFVLGARKALVDLAKTKDEEHVNRLWNHAGKVWDTVFQEEALAAMQENNSMALPAEENSAFLEKRAKEGHAAAIASLAMQSLDYAEKLIRRALQGDASAKRFAAELCIGNNRGKREIIQYLRKTVPLQWVLTLKKIDLKEVFETEKCAGNWDIECSLIRCWDRETRAVQIRMLKESVPEEALKEILEKRTKNLSFQNLGYLKGLGSILGLLVEVSPAIQRFIRAYKVALFQDPFYWRQTMELEWLPCSKEDRKVLGILEFRTLYASYHTVEWKDLLPGQQQFIEAQEPISSAACRRLLRESLNEGFQPAGIVLGEQLLERKRYEKAFAIFQQVIKSGAIRTYRFLVKRCLELVGNGALTCEEMGNLVLQLDNDLPVGDAIPPTDLHYFFMNIQNPDLRFFAIAAKIKDCSQGESWRKLLKRLRKLESVPVMVKMQMHLVGHQPSNKIVDLSNWINSAEWVETIKRSSDPAVATVSEKLICLTMTQMLQSEIKDCDYLVDTIAHYWLKDWVYKEQLKREITTENLSKAEFFWKRLNEILKHWEKTGKKSKFFEISMILIKQGGLATENRFYKKCLKRVRKGVIS